jgi:hypothetical protein
LGPRIPIRWLSVRDVEVKCQLPNASSRKRAFASSAEK